MSTREKSCEIPFQDFARIQLMFLPSTLSNGKLFTDVVFPPDKSSLTYVYSGDDRYDTMVFKRTKDICSYSVFAGVGGCYECPFPWRKWKKSSWFEAAIAIVSLNVKHLDKLVPGYRNFDQSLQNDYIGCFCFKLWRFGDWVDVLVDDHLPTLGNNLLYCEAYGTPKEFWGPLVEKAYAKCKKTYEANECGHTLDALTDLTGGVCEFYTPDINPPDNLFHVLYKSCVNRSQIVCWRNDKLLTSTGFSFENNEDEREDCDIVDGRSSDRYIHIVTAVTKFPLTDGRMIDMVRLLCTYKAEPIWNGKFANTDEISWGTVNMDFSAKYKPLENKDQSAYWLTLEDFRCNFGGLVICSTEIPYTTEGLNLERCYRRLSDDEIKSGQKSLFSLQKDRRRSSDGKHTHKTAVSYFKVNRNSIPYTMSSQTGHMSSTESGILVRENTRTVKVDNTLYNRGSRINKLKYKSKSDTISVKLDPVETIPEFLDRRQTSADAVRTKDHPPAYYFKRLQLYHEANRSEPEHVNESRYKHGSHGTEESTIPGASNSRNVPLNNRHFSGNRGSVRVPQNTEHHQSRSDSVMSSSSSASDCQSTFSTSDITIQLHMGISRENSLQRPQSAPSNIVRNASSGSLPNMMINNFIASSSDNFRSHGSWRFIIDYKGNWERKYHTNIDYKRKWNRCDSVASHADVMKLHARNARILLHVLNADAVNQLVALGYHGKSHVIISLLQDYRHGAPTANSLLVPIGFSVYKTKNPCKDEKRPLSKLCLVGEATPYNDSREITSRFDLFPGSYFIVPFCLSEGHSGQYILRVLAERDPVAGKTGW